MTTGLLGAAAFLLMALYDVDRAFWKKRLWFLFPVGVLLLLGATLLLLQGQGPGERPLWRLAFGGLAAESFLLLLYTQLAALQPGALGGGTQKLCKSGPYAVCRHPGLWPFLLLYLCLWLYVGGRMAFWIFLLFSGLDLLYIVLQDIWLFPRYIEGYSEYKKETPFLLPSLKKLRRAEEKEA